jgi:hypothetical protein
MKNVMHNGFNCPYCRTEMVELLEEEDSVASQDEEIQFEENERFRWFRLFWDNINEEDHEQSDIEAEIKEEEEWLRFDEEDAEESLNIPSVEYIAEELCTKHVCYQDLIRAILTRDHIHYDFSDTDLMVNGKIRSIISKYNPPMSFIDNNEIKKGNLTEKNIEYTE